MSVPFLTNNSSPTHGLPSAERDANNLGAQRWPSRRSLVRCQEVGTACPPLSGFAARCVRTPYSLLATLSQIEAGFDKLEILIRVSTDKRIAAKSIRRSRWRWPRGRLEASSIGGEGTAGVVRPHTRQGWPAAVDQG
jgi:hypothetical protein